MKRPLAIAFTVAIFAAIAVCFLRPAPNVFGHTKPIFEPNTPLELSGDTEYFERAEVKYVNYAEGLIELHLQPAEPYILYVGSHIGRYGMSGDDEGYIEKLVDGEWQYLCETGTGGAQTLEGGSPNYFSLVWDESMHSKYHQWYRVRAHDAMREPGEYRFTLNFRQIEGQRELVGDVITVSFTCTVPEPTDKRFDIYTMSDKHRPWIAVRSNRGKPAPYLIADSIRLTDLDTGEEQDSELLKWQIYEYFSWFDGELCASENKKFRVYSLGSYWRTYPHPALDGRYELYAEFADRPDGSGTHYPFTCIFG